MFAPTTSVGQTILEQPLSKNLITQIFNTILRINCNNKLN